MFAVALTILFAENVYIYIFYFVRGGVTLGYSKIVACNRATVRASSG
jgi:hypothetical protein